MLKDLKMNTRNLSIVFLGTILASINLWAAPVTLSDAMKYCMKNYPSIKAAELKVQAADWSLKNAYAQAWPSLSLDPVLSYSYLDPVSMMSIPGLGNYSLKLTEPIQKYSLALSVKHPLWVFDRLSHAQDFLTVSYEQSRLDLEKIQSDAIYNLIQTYYRLVFSQKNLELIHQNLIKAEAKLSQVKNQYESKLVPQSNYLRTEIQFRNLKLDESRAQKNLEMAKNALADFLPGIDLNKSELEMKFLPVQYSSHMRDETTLKERMYLKRADWKSILSARAITQTMLKLAEDDFSPMFQLQASYSLSKTNYPLWFDQNGWNVGVFGTWTLFNASATDYKVKSAKAQLESFDQTKKSAEQGLELMLHDTLLNYDQAEQAYENTQATVKLAQQNYYEMEALYRTQARTYLEFLDAQNTLMASELNVIASEMDLHLNDAKLSWMVGDLLSQLNQLP